MNGLQKPIQVPSPDMLFGFKVFAFSVVWCVCVCAHAHVRKNMYVGACTHICACGDQKTTSNVIPHTSSIFYLKRHLSLAWIYNRQARVSEVRSSHGFTSLYLPWRCWIQVHTLEPGLLQSSEQPVPGSHHCDARCLTNWGISSTN